MNEEVDYGGPVPPVIEQEDTGDQQPPAFDPEAFKQSVIEGVREAMRPPAPEKTEGVDPRFEQIVELSYTNPAAAEAMRLQIAEERAEARILEKLGPRLQPLTNYAYGQVTQGMDDTERKYVDGLIAKGIHPEAMLQSPELLTLAKDAAYGARTRASQPAPRAERMGGGAYDPDVDAAREQNESAYGDWGFKQEDFEKAAKR